MLRFSSSRILIEDVGKMWGKAQKKHCSYFLIHALSCENFNKKLSGKIQFKIYLK